VARDRQRSKQRQAERRARRIADGDDGVRQREGPQEAEAPGAAAPPEGDGAPDPRLAVGAPPENTGRVDPVLGYEASLDQAEPDEAEFDEAEFDEADFEDEAEAAEPDYAPRGRRGREAPHGRERLRFVQFLVNVWAELQRVQWPNRQQLFTLTWVVLGFVLIMGGYLGLLDAIFERLINSLL
jgi:preprotein translocase subunit SecE